MKIQNVFLESIGVLQGHRLSMATLQVCNWYAYGVLVVGQFSETKIVIEYMGQCVEKDLLLFTYL